MANPITVLFAGPRGLTGNKGDQGDQGDPGRSITVRGLWASGQVYRPGDAVTGDSTGMTGVNSLFVQRDTAPESVSNTPPRDDPGRWAEVGPEDLTSVTGTIWRVTQLAHGFTAVGQPVGYNGPLGRWVTTGNRITDEPAVAVVKEIVSVDEVVLQGSGIISNLDPSIILPPGATEYQAGALYFTAVSRGNLTTEQTTEAINFTSNAVLLATGPTEGIVLQWQSTPNIVGRRAVGLTTFFYEATPGQTVFSGNDLDGRTLNYVPSDQTEVYVDGVFLNAMTDFTAVDGTAVTLTAPLAGGEQVLIRVPAEPLTAIAPATSLPVDDISGLFDGVTTRFPLTVGGGAPLTFGPSQNTLVWLDGNAQEPFADYTVVPGVSTQSEIEFTNPPDEFTRFWALAGVAVSNFSFLEVDTFIATQATIQTLDFDSATGIDLTVNNLDALDIQTGTLAVLTSAVIEALVVSTSTTTATLNATTSITSPSITGTTSVTSPSIVATTSMTTPTITVAGATNTDSLAVTAGITGATMTLTGNASVAGLTASSFLNSVSITATGTSSAATLRAATLREPFAGGQINILNATFDEGTF